MKTLNVDTYKSGNHHDTRVTVSPNTATYVVQSVRTDLDSVCGMPSSQLGGWHATSPSLNSSHYWSTSECQARSWYKNN